jgi:hypothetical protein
MKFLAPYRIASYLLLFFAFTHTAGGLFGPHEFGEAAQTVFKAMRDVSFPAMGATRTWYDFWLGFGLVCTLFLLLSAVMAFHLGGMTPAARRPIAPICWAFFIAQVANAALSFAYFFAPPGVTATIVAALIGYECVRDLRAVPSGSAG